MLNANAIIRIVKIQGKALNFFQYLIELNISQVIFKKFSISQTFITFLVLKIVLGFVIHFLGSLVNTNSTAPDTAALEEKIAILFVVPILESLVFQFLIQEAVLKWFGHLKNKFLISLLVSSFLFAITHYYSTFYVLATFFSGVVYSGLYLEVRQKTNDKINAVALTALLHTFYNLFVFFFYDHR
jgi:membrane protease YdiL (CAAX protease family)